MTQQPDNTHEYRSDDEYDIYEVKVDCDDSIVPAVQRVVLEYIEKKHQVGILMKGRLR